MSVSKQAYIALVALLIGSFACNSFKTLSNINPDMGDRYYAAKASIARQESLCENANTWSLSNRGKRLTYRDVKKLCTLETQARWRFYDWAQCWNAHLDAGPLTRCGHKPEVPDVR